MPSLALADPSGCKTSTIEQILLANQEQMKTRPELKGLTVQTVTDAALVAGLAAVTIPDETSRGLVKSYIIYSLAGKATYFVFAFDAEQCGIARGEVPKNIIDGVVGRDAQLR